MAPAGLNDAGWCSVVNERQYRRLVDGLDEAAARDRARAELEPVARLLTRRCEEARAALARAGAEPHVPRAR